MLVFDGFLAVHGWFICSPLWNYTVCDDSTSTKLASSLI